jgi:hypothetical protein
MKAPIMSLRMTKRILASAPASAMSATQFRPGISAPLESRDGGANARAAPYYLRRRGGERNRAYCRQVDERAEWLHR